MKFHADRHFIYITTRADEHKEELQLYYKILEVDLEEINKDWLVDLLISIDPTDIYDLDSPETTHKEHDTHRPNRKKKTEEVQDLRSALGKSSSISPD
jgi:hypothetical protein